MCATRNGSFGWHNIFRPFKRSTETYDKKKDKEPWEITPIFNDKYKVVIKCDYSKWDKETDGAGFYYLAHWIDENIKTSVDFNFDCGGRNCWIAFEDPDDALIFRIKFG